MLFKRVLRPRPVREALEQRDAVCAHGSAVLPLDVNPKRTQRFAVLIEVPDVRVVLRSPREGFAKIIRNIFARCLLCPFESGFEL